jgi:hypothetical protein
MRCDSTYLPLEVLFLNLLDALLLLQESVLLGSLVLLTWQGSTS